MAEATGLNHLRSLEVSEDPPFEELVAALSKPGVDEHLVPGTVR